MHVSTLTPGSNFVIARKSSCRVEMAEERWFNGTCNCLEYMSCFECMTSKYVKEPFRMKSSH